MKRIFLMCAAMIALTASTFGVCNETDRSALEAFDHAWSDAIDKGDRAALMAILADDFTGMPTMVNKTLSIENSMAAFERNRASPQNEGQTSSDLFMISCTPNTATITHRNV